MDDPKVNWISYLKTLHLKQNIFKIEDENKWPENAKAPLVPLKKPIKDCRIGLTACCAARLKTQSLWEKEERKDPGWRQDISFREIPMNSKFKDIIITAASYSYDAMMDPNIMLPLDRMMEMEKEGYYVNRHLNLTHHRRPKMTHLKLIFLVKQPHSIPLTNYFSFSSFHYRFQ